MKECGPSMAHHSHAFVLVLPYECGHRMRDRSQISHLNCADTAHKRQRTLFTSPSSTTHDRGSHATLVEIKDDGGGAECLGFQPCRNSRTEHAMVRAMTSHSPPHDEYVRRIIVVRSSVARGVRWIRIEQTENTRYNGSQLR